MKNLLILPLPIFFMLLFSCSSDDDSIDPTPPDNNGNLTITFHTETELTNSTATIDLVCVDAYWNNPNGENTNYITGVQYTNNLSYSTIDDANSLSANFNYYSNEDNATPYNLIVTIEQGNTEVFNQQYTIQPTTTFQSVGIDYPIEP